MGKGVFITFEGIDGVGKTTQLNILCKQLQKLGYTVVKTREPGGTCLGRQIRQILLAPTDQAISQQAEILLYAADRAQHVQEIVKPALAAGKIVVCDRYVDSSIAYQGYGLGWDVEAIVQINQKAIDGLMPHLTLCLDNEPELTLTRTKGDRIEQRDIAYYQRVRQGYQEIAQQYSERFKIISAQGSIEEVSQRVWKIIQERGLV